MTDRPLTVADVEAGIALLSAEADYVAELVARGILPPGARREPSAAELRSGCRFAALDRIVEDATGLLVRATLPVRALLLEELAGTIRHQARGSADPYAVVEALTGLTPDEVPGLEAAIAAAVVDVVDQLRAVAQAGADEALDEARRQGLDQLPAVDADTGEVQAAAAAHAGRLLSAAFDRLRASALEAAGRAATAPGATIEATIVAAVDAARVTDGKL